MTVHDELQTPPRPAPDGSDVRRVSHSDVPRIARALARAFEDDPVMSWVFRDDSERLSRLGRGFALYLRRLWLPHDECYLIDGRRSGAALWLPPGKWRLSPAAQLRLLPHLLRATGRNFTRLARVLHTMEVRHPEDPHHFYLAVLGVEPELQGRGFGSSLLQPVLRRCDDEGIPAFLESSKRRNIVFYERHGFRVVEEIQLPGGGPPLWPMWRDPRG